MAKRVYLCQPYSYSIEPEAGEARMLASQFTVFAVNESGMGARICSSVLCDSFNIGIAECRNGKYDYLAMIHSDISAKPGWLGTLMDALEESGADIIHAASCIKDERYQTSTALAYSPDIHQLKRRLTVKEIFRLPDVFTLEHVQKAIDPDAQILLPNTGCLLCKVGEWFYDWPGFHMFNDVQPDANGVHRSRVVSEDYMLGYYAAEHGIKVSGTRRVVTHHYGRKDFNTTEPRGMGSDRHYLQLIGKPPVGESWVFPSELDGWLTSVEGVGLAKFATGKRVLEIGSYCGKSTICMAQKAAHVVAVDPHDGRATTKQRDTLNILLANLSKYRCTNVTVHRATSEDFAKDYRGAKFDAVFIDGDHSQEAVERDIEIAESFLVPDGPIAFHDVREFPGEHDGGWNEGVSKAVADYINRGAALVERHGTVAIVRPPALVKA